MDGPLVEIPGIAVAVIGLENISELEKAASVVASTQPLSSQESLELARVGLELYQARQSGEPPMARRWRDRRRPRLRRVETRSALRQGA